MKKFVWGKKIDCFSYNFDGRTMDVVKFHPWKMDGITVLSGQPDETEVRYHCEELHESAKTLHALVIAWIVRMRLGLNQHALVAGICRALGIHD